MKKIMELYKKGMPIRATFFLFFGVCSVGIVITSIMNFIVVGIIMGIIFTYLNFSWLPEVYLNEDKAEKEVIETVESINNNPVNNSYTKTVINNITVNKDEVKSFEINNEKVKVKYNDFIIVQNCFYSTKLTKDDIHQWDYNTKRIPDYAREKIAEGYNSFEPKINPDDGRHYLYLENYCTYNDYYKDTKFNTLKAYQVIKLPRDFSGKFREYIKVKFYDKFEKKSANDQTIYCLKIADKDDKYIFEDEIHVDKDIYDNAQEGKEYYLFRHYLIGQIEYVLKELSFLEFDDANKK